MKVIVPNDLGGSRLDRALAALYPAHSRSFLARLVEDGRVSVGGRHVTKPSHRLDPGDEIELDIPPPAPAEIASQNLPLTILHEDDDIVVLDKPPGLVVHPAAGHADQTLVNALLFHVKDLSGVGGELRPGIVHRLDKDTSGVLLVAKTPAALEALASQFRARTIEKRYTALVHGSVRAARGTIDRPIGRDGRDRLTA